MLARTWTNIPPGTSSSVYHSWRFGFSLFYSGYNTDARGHSTCGKTRTSLKHLKNVLSCVNRSYQLPFTLHRYTWKRTSITQCLVNSHKNTSRRNPSIGKTPMVFFFGSTCIAIAKPYTKCMSQYSTRENTKGILATLHNNLPTIHNAAVNCTTYIPEARTSPMCSCLSLAELRYMTTTERIGFQLEGKVCGPARRPLFSGHYPLNHSTLDMGVLGYIGVL